jgi:hypothetical protein
MLSKHARCLVLVLLLVLVVVSGLSAAENPTDYSYRIEGSFFGGAMMNNLWDSPAFSSTWDYRTRILPAIAVDFLLENFTEVGPAKLGFRAGVGYQGRQLMPNLEGAGFIDLHVLPKLDMPFGESFSVEGALGIALAVGNIPTEPVFLYGLTGLLGLRFNITEAISVGVQPEGRLLFQGGFDPYDFTGTIRISAGYKL